MAEESAVPKTYGVGPAAEKKNIGKLVNAKARLDSEGKVTDRGELVFDPTVNSVELIEEDGVTPEEAEEAEDSE